jgi:hypothetical protein
MGISDLPFHRVRIAVAIMLSASVVLVWAGNWARCQPSSDASPYFGIVLFASLLGCVLWATATLPALLAGSRWPVVMLALGLGLAAMIALVAGNAMFGSHAVCTGDKWGG